MSDAFSERMRLIRLRRKIEKPRFRDELKLIPKWLVWTLAFLYVVAVVLAIVINLYQDGGQSIQPSQLRGNPALASLAMAGMVTGVAIVLSVWLMALGYVYRDAKRRDMNPVLWTLLCMLLSWPFLRSDSFSIFKCASRCLIPARAVPRWSALASTSAQTANAICIPAAPIANAKWLRRQILPLLCARPHGKQEAGP